MNSKERVAKIKQYQMKGVHLPCPRCGRYNMDSHPVRNAMSRHADIYICDECGMDEAIRDFTGSALPLEDWAMNQWNDGGGR